MNESITINILHAAIAVSGIVIGCLIAGYRQGHHDGYLKREIEELAEDAKAEEDRDREGA